VLGIVVVPGHAVMIQKSKEPLSMLFEPLSIPDRDLVFELALRERIVKICDRAIVFAQVACLQTKAVDALDDRPEQHTERVSDLFDFIVERLLTHVFVQISHQMYEALLLLQGRPSYAA
jgi:hypothetical protein